MLKYRAAALQTASLHDFVRLTWSLVEPAAPFVDNWHLGAVCEFLTAWRQREFKNAVLNLPPGTGKSLLVDVFFPAWVWSTEPGHKFMCCAFDQDLCLRDADKVQTILSSDVYRLAFPDSQLRPDHKARGDLWTTMGGYRFSTSPQGRGGLGRHFHSVSVNDPVNPKHTHATQSSELGAGVERAQQWFDGTLPSRRADPARFGVMLTMQRLIEKDLAGVCLERGFEHLCLPMRYEPKAHWIRGEWTSKLERRTQPGELLHPRRYPEPTVRELETALAEHAPAQLQQNPIPRSGGLLEEPHLAREWVEWPKRGAYVIQVWDFAAKGTAATHSAVHGALWCSVEVDVWRTLTNTLADRDRGAAPESVLERGQKETRYLLLDEVWGIWSVPESEAQFEAAQRRPGWERTAQRIIEAKAAGIGIIQRYERNYSGVVAFHEVNDDCKALATADKLDRLRANLGEWHAGRVLLPPWSKTVADRVDPKDGSGPDAFRRELLAFPRGARDDRVDTSSMALARLVQGTSQWWGNVRQLVRQGQRPEPLR